MSHSFATPKTIAHQAPLSMGFPRQEYWSGLLFPPPEDLPNPEIEPLSPVSPAPQAVSLPLNHLERSEVQLLSHVRPHGQQASLSISNSKLAQTYVHRVTDAIQPSHPLSSPSPPSFNLSQHQGIFQRVSSLHQVAKVLEFQLQHQSFQ